MFQRGNLANKGEYDGSSPGSVGENQKSKGVGGVESNSRDSSSCITSCLEDWDIVGLPGVSLLSEAVSDIYIITNVCPLLVIVITDIGNRCFAGETVLLCQQTPSMSFFENTASFDEGNNNRLCR